MDRERGRVTWPGTGGSQQKHAEGAHRYLFTLGAGSQRTRRRSRPRDLLSGAEGGCLLQGTQPHRPGCAPLPSGYGTRELSRRELDNLWKRRHLSQVPPPTTRLWRLSKVTTVLLYQAIQKLSSDTRRSSTSGWRGTLQLPGNRHHSGPYRGVGPDAVLP